MNMMMMMMKIQQLVDLTFSSDFVQQMLMKKNY